MRRMILKYFISPLLCILLLSASVWAQIKDVRFKNIGLKEGLSHNKAHCVLKDSKGFIWIGTRDGLNLYDGYNFTIYRHDPKDSSSITSSRIQVLFEDSRENIWIGTYDGGINVYNRYTQTFRSFQHNPEDPNSISSNNIYKIFEDSKQQIWIGTYGGGLCRFNEDQLSFEVFRNDPGNANSLTNNAVFDILEDNGKLWLATFGGGLSVYDPATQTFTAYQHIPEDLSSIPTNDLYTLCKDLSGNIWIGTYGKGLTKFNVTTKHFTTYTHQPESNAISSNYVLSLTTDHLGNLWIATQDGGVNYLEVNTEKFHVFKKSKLGKHEIHTDHINAVYLDKATILWVATDGEGIYNTNAQSVIFDNFIGDGIAIPGFMSKSVTAIYEDTQNNLWIGSFGEGVYKIDHQQQKVFNYTQNIFDENGLAGNFITAIVEDRHHTLWIGTLNEGLSRFNPQSGQWKTYQYQSGHAGSLSNNTVNALHVDKQGNLWVGTDGGGLCKFNEDTETFTAYMHDPYRPDRSLVGNAVKVIFEDESSLWLGTKSSGISRLELSTYEFTNFQHTDGDASVLPSNEIIDIVKDKQGKLWIGTFDQGICQLNIKDRTYLRLTSEHGLISDNICSLLDSEDGFVWVSTTRGLSRLNLSTLHIQNFTTEDGLHNQEFVQWSGFKNKKNELFLGHLGGFTRFDPKLVDTHTEYQAPVYITSFRLFDEKVKLETPNFAFHHMELKHNDNFFELEYALLSYKNPIENEYAYIMENLDQNWKYVGHRRIASYTNLDAGTYTFKVKAKDKNGSWHEIAKPVTIVIHPAWYNTWWFKIVVFLAIISLCLLYYYNKINVIKQRNEQLEHLVAERTHELVEKNEEIHTQKENIEEQNDRLIEVQAIIQERNRELRIMNEELEDRVEQRTRELKQANTQLQKANEELDTFVYRSYHDIIGPISRIQGLCYVAAIDVKDAGALEYIAKLSDSSDKAKSTLLRVLSIYHIRNHEVKIAETDVLELIYSITARFEKQLINVNLDVEYGKDFFALIKTDQELLRTILTNLIENAIKYSRFEEDSQIKIILKRLTVGGRPPEINFQIRDNGIGIEKEVRNKVFTMFFRGNNERSGTGLGLYLTKIAVQKLGGTIHYQHTTGNETLFNLKLPLMPADLTSTPKVMQENKH